MADILGEEPITLRRTAAGSRDALGDFVAGTTSTSSIKASVQPLTGKDADSLPEGERHKDWLKLYTRTELRPVSQHAGSAGDRVEVDGITYEVRTVKRYRAVCPHYRADVVRTQEGGT